MNPLLALAQLLRAEGHEVFALGTKEGLEQRLVPERGFELFTIKKLPFPRKLSIRALAFPLDLMSQTMKVIQLIRRLKVDVVVGFGGYASPPAYLAAFLLRKPLIVHEANAIAGYANKLGQRLGGEVAIAFPNTNLQGELTGMPIRSEIIESIAEYDKGQARVELGLDPILPTLLVTGGSLGARTINQAVIASLDSLRAAGVQVLHIVGEHAGLGELSEPGYRRMVYCSRMDAAIAASDLAISRAGSSTLAEFAAAGLPAIYVPYPVGNGEQRHNAKTIVDAGGGQLVLDSDFSAEFITNRVIPIISHANTLKQMSQASRSVAIPDATARLRDLVISSVNTKKND